MPKANTSKKTFKPTAKSKAARKRLIAISQVAKQQKKILLSNAQSDAEALAIAATPINHFILEIHKEETGQSDFRRFDEWREAGYKIKKGSESVRVWGTPKQSTKHVDVVDVKTGEDKTIEDRYEFWPMCALFHAGQVEPFEESAAA
jgi:hypothetical protein